MHSLQSPTGWASGPSSAPDRGRGRGGGRWGRCEAVNDRQCELKGQSSEAIKGVIRGHQGRRPPRRGGCHPVPSSAIQCHPVQSRTIKRNQAHRGEEVAIQCYPVPSSAITHNHAQSSAIKRTAARRLTMKGPI